jgi:hypothetical protein
LIIHNILCDLYFELCALGEQIHIKI